MESRVIYRIIWLLVLLPTFVASAFFLLLGLAASMGMLYAGPALAPLVLAALLTLGGFGLVTLSRLDDHVRNYSPLGDIRLHMAGLVAGSLAALALLWLIPEQRMSLWPLIAAGYFLVRIRGLRRAV